MDMRTQTGVLRSADGGRGLACIAQTGGGPGCAGAGGPRFQRGLA